MVSPQLKWACRRGMLELDILLGQFLEEAYSELTAEEQAQFRLLLQSEDQELFFWLTNKELAPVQFIQLIEKIRTHARTRHHT